MVRRSLYTLAAVAGMGLVRAEGLFIPGDVLRQMGNSASDGVLMITETSGGDFRVVSNGETPVYITESSTGHSEVNWSAGSENRMVPVYAPSAEEVRESIPTYTGEAPAQYIAPQQAGFVSSTTPVIPASEGAPATGAVVGGTALATGAAASGETKPAKGGAADTKKSENTKEKSKSSTKTKKKGVKSVVALGATAVAALFAIVM